MKKKVLVVTIFTIMILLLIFSNSVFAETESETDDKPQFRISENFVMKRDESSTLEVTVNEKLEFMSFRANWEYDSDGFEITSIDKGEILPDRTQLSVLKNEQGKITGFSIENDTKERIEINEGVIAKINIKTKENAEFGKYKIRWIESQLLHDDSEEIKVSAFPGSVIVTGTNDTPGKQSFQIAWNHQMAPGEEQTISVKNEDKLWIHYMSTELLYDEDIQVVGIMEGKDLPEDAEIVPFYNGIVGDIIGFGIQSKSDNLIRIDPNLDIVDIKIKVKENTTQKEDEFAIVWDHILDENWNEEIADDNIIEIAVNPVPPLTETPEATTPTTPTLTRQNFGAIIFVSVIAVALLVAIVYTVVASNKKDK